MAEIRLDMLDDSVMADVLASVAQFELAALRLDDHNDDAVEDGVLLNGSRRSRLPWWTEVHAARSLELPIPTHPWQSEHSHSWFRMRVSGTAASLKTVSLPCPPQRKPNSMRKLKLYPTRRQRYLLEQLFRIYRAVYNKLVCEFRTRFEHVPRLERPSLLDVMKEIRRYTTKGALPDDAVRLPPRFPEPVLNSAYRDFQSGRRSAWASFKAIRQNGKHPGIPTTHFKSKKSASASIGIRVKKAEINSGVRFCPTYMELPNEQGIFVKPFCPENFDHMCRLQRLRSQDYFLCVPRRQLPSDGNEIPRLCNRSWGSLFPDDLQSDRLCDVSVRSRKSALSQVLGDRQDDIVSSALSAQARPVSSRASTSPHAALCSPHEEGHASQTRQLDRREIRRSSPPFIRDKSDDEETEAAVSCDFAQDADAGALQLPQAARVQTGTGGWEADPLHRGVHHQDVHAVW